MFFGNLRINNTHNAHCHHIFVAGIKGRRLENRKSSTPFRNCVRIEDAYGVLKQHFLEALRLLIFHTRTVPEGLPLARIFCRQCI